MNDNTMSNDDDFIGFLDNEYPESQMLDNNGIYNQAKQPKAIDNYLIEIANSKAKQDQIYEGLDVVQKTSIKKFTYDLQKLD